MRRPCRLAEDRQAPRIFGKLSRRNVPQNALICSCLLLLCGIGFLYASETINQAFILVTSITSVLFLFIWALIVVCYIVYRKKHPELHARSVYKMPGGVAMCWACLVFFAAVLVLLSLQDDTRQALIASPAWFVLLGVGYWVRRRTAK